MKAEKLPQDLRRQTVYFVRQYDEKKLEYETLAWASAENDGQPRSTAPGDPTASRAARAARIGTHLKAIDTALDSLPEYYRKPIFEHTAHRVPFPDYADRKTFYRYERLFLYRVAYTMGWT